MVRYLPTPKTVLCNSGALTARGAIQHLMLGNHLREAYIRDIAVISNISVYTTASERTRHSALAFLHGLLHESTADTTRHKVLENVHFCGETHPAISCPCYLVTAKKAKQGDLSNNKMPYSKRHAASVDKLSREAKTLWQTVSGKIQNAWKILASDVPDKRSLNAILMASLCDQGKLACEDKRNPDNCLRTNIMDELFHIFELDDERKQLSPHVMTRYYLDAVPILLDIIDKARAGGHAHIHALLRPRPNPHPTPGDTGTQGSLFPSVRLASCV